jgi:hypothetical protein
MIDNTTSLEDVAFAICTELNIRGLKVVLVGGSAATYYAPEAYQSSDADFVAQFVADKENETKLVAAMNDLGYELKGNSFHHPRNPFTVEFPKGPLGIGGDDVGFDTIDRGSELLYIISATDCVRDRLCHYFYWNDRTALRAAVDVSLAVPDAVDLKLIRTWSAREGHVRGYADFSQMRESK